MSMLPGIATRVDFNLRHIALYSDNVHQTLNKKINNELYIVIYIVQI